MVRILDKNCFGPHGPVRIGCAPFFGPPTWSGPHGPRTTNVSRTTPRGRGPLISAQINDTVLYNWNERFRFFSRLSVILFVVIRFVVCCNYKQVIRSLESSHPFYEQSHCLLESRNFERKSHMVCRNLVILKEKVVQFVVI